jgi:uncharacterized membrane protein YdbT with pleckstrin-like domain
MQMELEEEHAVWQGRPSQMVNLATFAACGLLLWLVVPIFVAAQRFLEVHFTRYVLTSERFEITTGVLSRRIDQVELYRVKDLGVEEPLALRMVGLGNLIVRSSDRSHPTLVLRGVRECRLLRDQVRGLVEKRRDEKRVHELDV